MEKVKDPEMIMVRFVLVEIVVAILIIPMPTYSFLILSSDYILIFACF